MRDDVKDHFDALLIQLHKRKILLNKLLESEKSLSGLIKYRNDSEDEILKIIEYESSLIEKIDVEDYYISRIKDEISRKYGIDFRKISEPAYTTPEPLIQEIIRETGTHDKIIAETSGLKEYNNSRIEKNCEDLKRQIDELSRMGRLKIFMPKDPQSS